MLRELMWCLASAAALLALAIAPAQAQPTTAGADQSSPARTRAEIAKAENAKADQEDGKGGCVYINQLQGDHALNDRSVIFRANVSDFYRLNFAQRCVELTYPQPVLILTPAGGNGLVCRAIDLDVKVGQQGPGSFPTSCIPSSLHKMSPEEVAAVPRKDLP